MTYGEIFAILLYRVIGRIRMMTLHLGVLNEESDMRGRTWDHVHGVSVKIRCPRGLGVGICAQLCVYVFGIVWIVVHYVGGMSYKSCNRSWLGRLLLQLCYGFL